MSKTKLPTLGHSLDIYLSAAPTGAHGKAENDALHVLNAADDLRESLEYFAGFAPSIDDDRDDGDECDITVTLGALREAREAIAKAEGK